jgi:hypothetical protein
MAAIFRIQRPPEGVTKVARGDFDFYFQRLIKMIPGEALGLYTVGVGVIPNDSGASQAAWAFVCLIAVILIRIKETRNPKRHQPTQWPVVAIASGAFLIWVYTLGGPFAFYHVHIPYVGSLLAIAYTFFVPLLYKGDYAPSAAK